MKSRLRGTLLFLLIMLAICPPIIHASPDTESLYVDGFNDLTREWTEVGASPWLNDNTGNYLYDNNDGDTHLEFTFADHAGSETINSVTFYAEIQGPSARNDKVKITMQIQGGGVWLEIMAQDSDADDWAWYNADISGYANTWTKINYAKIRVDYEKSGSPSTQTLYIRRAYIIVDYEAPLISVTHDSLESNETEIDDLESFYLNVTISFIPDSDNFTRNILTLDPSGLSLNITYLNGTGFSELNDANNYIGLDVSNSNKTDISQTQLYLMYVLKIYPNITKDGLFDVYSATNDTQGYNDKDTFTDVFNLTIRLPGTSTLLFGAGFNASTPFIETYWVPGALTTDYEVQNSTDAISWFSLAYPSNPEYNDTSPELNNGTYRYYRVRSRRQTGGVYLNSSWTDVDLERVWFSKVGDNGEAPPPIDDYSIIFLAMGLVGMLAIAFLYTRDK